MLGKGAVIFLTANRRVLGYIMAKVWFAACFKHQGGSRFGCLASAIGPDGTVDATTSPLTSTETLKEC